VAISIFKVSRYTNFVRITTCTVPFRNTEFGKCIVISVFEKEKRIMFLCSNNEICKCLDIPFGSRDVMTLTFTKPFITTRWPIIHPIQTQCVLTKVFKGKLSFAIDTKLVDLYTFISRTQLRKYAFGSVVFTLE